MTGTTTTQGVPTMGIEVTCRIADGAIRFGELDFDADVDHSLDGPLFVNRSWTLDTRATWDETKQGAMIGNALVGVEITLPDRSTWTGKAYLVHVEAHDVPVTPDQHELPVQVQLAGSGPLTPKGDLGQALQQLGGRDQ